MFLGKAIYETLSENGDIHSYYITPVNPHSRLIVDELEEIDRLTHRSKTVDLGPLRMYAERSGLRFQSIPARLSGSSFRKTEEQISFERRYKNVPLEPNHSGYYGILLPAGYSGQVELEIKVAGENQASQAKRVFLSDTQQIFLSSGFRVYADQWVKPNIRVYGKLTPGNHDVGNMKVSSFSECFGRSIDGLHHGSVASLIREINKGLSSDSRQVFICHSSRDKEQARRMATALAGRGIRVWIDEAEIKIGDSLIGKIEDGIISSQNLIIILTPNSTESRWCKEELRMALAMQIGGEQIRVLPALFENCDIPGFLREKAYADFRNTEHFHEMVDELEAAIQ